MFIDSENSQPQTYTLEVLGVNDAVLDYALDLFLDVGVAPRLWKLVTIKLDLATTIIGNLLELLPAVNHLPVVAIVTSEALLEILDLSARDTAPAGEFVSHQGPFVMVGCARSGLSIARLEAHERPAATKHLQRKAWLTSASSASRLRREE